MLFLEACEKGCSFAMFSLLDSGQVGKNTLQKCSGQERTFHKSLCAHLLALSIRNFVVLVSFKIVALLCLKLF